MSQAAVGSTLQQQQSPAEGTPAAALDESLLVLLVCPLAKTPLRYDALQQLLINDELGVSYPVVKGVPFLVPTHGKLLHQQQQQQQEGWQAGNS
ncbi:hypothetical protein COO60DRAFT_1553084 [Scenedesmus sp. NREL 46B-D3]|nr:hypothetical protein COO60DRAFT_1553084 [Scenedesmus sp. NREL 46B-D3]